MFDLSGFIELPWYITLTILGLSMAGPYAWWSLTDPNKRTQRRARANYDQLVNNADQRIADLSVGRRERLLVPVVTMISTRIKHIAPSSLMSKLDRSIQRSGRAGSWTAERLLSVQILGFIVAGIFGAWVGPMSFPGRGPIVAVLFAGIGAMLPMTMFKRWGKARQKEIGQDLADIIDQITISVEAGLGFDSALMRVARDSQSPLGQELGRAVQDMRIGLSRDEAFQNLIDRTDVDDLNHFLSSVSQATELGVPLGRALRYHAVDLRRQRRVRAEEQAMKIGVKLTFPTVLFILPALLMVVLGPAVLSIMEGFSAQ